MGAITLDRDTERLAERLADAKGISLNHVVRAAIEASAQQAGVLENENTGRSPEVKMARALEITARFSKRPTLDHRTADEIIDYNEFGVPE